MGKGGSEEQTTKEVDKTTQTQGQTVLDPNSRRFVEEFLRPLGQQGAAAALGTEGNFTAGPNEFQQQAMSGLSQLVGPEGALGGEGGAPDIGSISAGSLGFTPEQLDTARIRDFFNPFEKRVVESLQPTFDRQREAALTQGAQQATGAGAFGGSRSGFLQAQALRDVNQDEAATIANLRRQGFESASDRALSENQMLQSLGSQGAIAELDARTQAKIANQQAQLQAQRIGSQRRAMQLQGLGQLMSGGEQFRNIETQRRRDPLFRSQQALQFGNLGLGPTGQVTSGRTGTQGVIDQTTKESGGGFFGSVLPNLVGAGLAIGGSGIPGAIGGLFGGGDGGGGSEMSGVGLSPTEFPILTGDEGFFGGVR